MAAGAVAISFAAIFFRLAQPCDPLVASALRLGISAVVLAALPAARAPMDARARRAAMIAGLAYAVHFGAWVASLGLTTVAASVTLVTTTPLLLAAVAWASRRDQPRPAQVVAALVAVVGAALIGGDDLFGGRLVGDALALLGAAAMAAFLWVARDLGEALSPLALSMRAAAWGSALLALVIATRAPIVSVSWPSWPSFGWIALSALIPQVVGHTLLTRALKHATPTEVGLATTLEPVLSTLLAWWWLAELPTGWVLVGCGVTLVGVGIGVLGPQQMRRDPPKLLE